MKFISTASFLISFLFSSALLAQIQTGTEPISFHNGLHVFDADLNAQIVAAPDMDSINREDEVRDKTGLPKFDARRVAVNFNLNEHGEWFALENGARLWKMKIFAPGALSLEMYYNDLYIPEGAELHLYSEDMSSYIGAFTSVNNSKSGYYSTDMIYGETTILEYYEPANVKGEGRISIENIAYRYRDLSNVNRADDCQVDVKCPEGDDWQDEVQSVIRLRISSSSGVYYCSGSLMNNTALDCKPYLLSAFHCVDNIVNNQSDLDQLRFYFNYQRPGCEQGQASAGQVTVGCTVKARSQNGGGGGSDFVLLLLEDEIPESYTPYYNGWNTQTSTISGGGVGIHHPNGDEKKISTSTQNFVSTAYSSGGPLAFFRVRWAGTESGHGVTEGGSSGSPLFDSNHLVIGTLTGGLSYCNSVQPGGQTQPDWYGKFGYHWDQNNGSQVIDLKGFLDPENTGQSVLLGTFAPCSSTGLEDSDNEIAANVSIYPNPSGGLFSIDLNQYSDEVEFISVQNSIGQTILTLSANSSVLQFDLGNEPSGLYFVTLKMKDQRMIGKKVAIY